MFKLLVVIALFGVAFAQRNPNPCEGVAEGVINTFRNDYSVCEDYFWCNGPNAIPTGPCNPTFTFDEAAQVCDTAAACEPCPAGVDIAVGVAGDTTCTQYTFCVAGVRSADPPLVCPVGTRFNRVTGQCGLAENVPCLSADGPPPTPGCIDGDGNPITGDIESPTGCADFMFCVEGVLDEVRGVLSCDEGLYFNPANRQCDLKANRDPPCAALAIKSQKSTPKAKHVSRNLSLRERIARRLHL